MPWYWVEHAILSRLEKIRTEVDQVQMRLEFHPSWLRVWEAVNLAISDVKEMRRLAYQAQRPWTELGCPGSSAEGFLDASLPLHTALENPASSHTALRGAPPEESPVAANPDITQPES